jgi:hypothetical protein
MLSVYRLFIRCAESIRATFHEEYAQVQVTRYELKQK